MTGTYTFWLAAGLIAAPVIGVTLGLVTRPPLGRGWFRRP